MNNIIIKVLIEAFKMLLGLFVIICICMSGLYLFMLDMKHNPTWFKYVPYIIYPVTLFAIAYIRVKDKK